jgi:hypothetical protein
VVDYVEFDPGNKQSYYVLDYPYGRTDYIKGGKPSKLLRLIKYMVSEGWNFPWDKTSIRDISVNGRVHDVADLFRSKAPIHLSGTIYSVLYSLKSLSDLKYSEFIKYCGLQGETISDIPFIAMNILREMGLISWDDKNANRQDTYIHLIGNVILQGRNCASVEDVSKGDAVKFEYLSRFWKGLPEEKRRLRLNEYTGPVRTANRV